MTVQEFLTEVGDMSVWWFAAIALVGAFDAALAWGFVLFAVGAVAFL